LPNEPRNSRRWAEPGSFGALISQRRQWLERHLPPDVAAYQYDVFLKSSQKRLAQRLGLSVAQTYFGPAPLAEVLAWLPSGAPHRFALKPDSGHSAMGFHRFVREGDSFREAPSGRRHTPVSIARLLRREMAGTERADSWLVEELLLPVDGSEQGLDDLKFYCFGGTAEVILHKWPAPGPRGTQRNWYDRDWNPMVASTRRGNDGPPRAPVHGTQVLALAEAAAASLCYPFIRIDLYDTSRGIVFGEFTPGPGMVQFFPAALQERFRVRWHEAEATILERLRSGALVPIGPECPADAVGTDAGPLQVAAAMATE
jgi:hypothetical protein